MSEQLEVLGEYLDRKTKIAKYMEQFNELDLDELVHDYFSKKASNLNNEGLKAQIEFLIDEGWLE